MRTPGRLLENVNFDVLRKRFFVFDPLILISAMFLIAAGVVAIYSSGYEAGGDVVDATYIKQIVFGVAGVVAIFVVMMMNYIKLAEHRNILYGVVIVLLLLVLIPGIGRSVHGSRSWLFFFQPSEFGKLLMIVVLAGFLDHVGDEITTFKRFAQAVVIMGVPMTLILLQPDFGTFLVYVPIMIVMLFVAGARARYLLALLVVGVLGLAIPMFLEYARMLDITDSAFFIFFSNRLHILYLAWFFFFVAFLLFIVNFYMKNKRIARISYIFFILFLSMIAAIVIDIALRPYQKHRLLVFLNPEMYRDTSGYNIIQSLIAIGSGGAFGRGFLQGSQSQLNFIPQQVNDFIFSNIGEEWGFFGGALVVTAFFVLIYRSARIAYQAKDRLGGLIATGIMTLFLFHVLINVGMVIGLMPITGIPLPFMSAGGSSLLTFCMAVGLLFSVESRRFVHRD